MILQQKLVCSVSREKIEEITAEKIVSTLRTQFKQTGGSYEDEAAQKHQNNLALTDRCSKRLMKGTINVLGASNP
ncbi:unnamed protein product [Urochloa humidicola]